jgi:hypothetical protein
MASQTSNSDAETDNIGQILRRDTFQLSVLLLALAMGKRNAFGYICKIKIPYKIEC